MDVMDSYKTQGFVPFQLYQIREGLEAGIDVSRYADPHFNWYQMEQIKLGLIDGLDVSVYAHPNIPSDEMEHIREKMTNASGITDLKEEEVRKKKLVNTSLTIVIFAAVAALCVTAFLLRDQLKLYFQNMEITLTAEEVNLEYGTPFLAADYLASYTQADNVELILPESLDTTVLGTHQVHYQLTNGKKTYSKSLLVNVVDQEAPTLSLSEKSVELEKNDSSFNCQSYVSSAEDNADGDLKTKVACSSALDPNQEEQSVLYTVTDSSGNKTDADLTVTWKKEAAPVIVNNPAPAEKQNVTAAVIQTPEPTAYIPPAEPVQSTTQDSTSTTSSWSETESWSSSGSYEVPSDVQVEYGEVESSGSD